MTGGIDAVDFEGVPPLAVRRNALSAVTGWLAGEFWTYCNDPITSTWTGCLPALNYERHQIVATPALTSGSYTVNILGLSVDMQWDTSLSVLISAINNAYDPVNQAYFSATGSLQSGLGGQAFFNYIKYLGAPSLPTFTNNTTGSLITASIYRAYQVLPISVSTTWNSVSLPSTTWVDII